MQIVGLPQRINKQLALLPTIQKYYEELAANPSYVKTGEIDYLLNDFSDDKLRDALIYVGKHNTLPPHSEIQELTNPACVRAYRQSMEFGWANLRFLQRVVKATFMPDESPSKIMYARQVALYCKLCGEYKASGMFAYDNKDESYTEHIRFTDAHIINPDTTSFKLPRRRKGNKRPKKRIHCETCGTYANKNLEKRMEGVYASAREYIYSPLYLEQLASESRALPKVLSVRIRTKEPASEAEKVAARLSAKRVKQSRHIQAVMENMSLLEETIGKEQVERLIEDNGRSIYDKFGMRIITPDTDTCYQIMEWFKEKFPITRFADYIAEPKENDYRSLHATLVSLPTDRFTQELIGVKMPVDLQIRSNDMHRTAESGTAARGPEKGRRELVDHKLFLAMTVLRHHMFGV